MSPQLISKELNHLFLVVTLSVLAMAGCDQHQADYDHLSKAHQHYQEHQYQAAIIELKNALQKDPNNGEARYLFALIHNDLGKGVTAEIELRKSLKLGASEDKIHAALGQALLLQKQYQKVLDEITVTNNYEVKIAADIYRVRGDAYAALKKAGEAKSAYKNALKLYPASSDAYLGMGRLAAMQNDMNEALNQTDTALSHAPENMKIWLIKANILRGQNKNKEARAAYQHILQIDQRNIYAHLGLALTALATNNIDEAKAEIDAAEEIAPKSLQVHYAQALIEFQKGNFTEAHEAIQYVLKGAPDHLPAILLRGAIGFTQESYEQTSSDLKQFLAQHPDHTYARRLLAATQLKMSKTELAMSTLQPLLNADHKDAQALALAGEILMTEKNFTEATKYLQKAIELKPQAQQLQTQLAISHLGAGDVEQAMNELEEAAKQASGLNQADIILIVTHLQQKEYDQALALISNLGDKHTPNPVIYNLKGAALLGKNSFSDARKAFETALSIQATYFPAITNLTQLDLRNNKPNNARLRLEAFLKKDNSNAEAMLALADLASIQKNEQEYVSWLEKAASVQPNLIPPRVKLANYYLKKDKSKALTIATEAVNTNPNNPEALGLLSAMQLATGDNKNALATCAKLVKKAPNAPSAYLQLALAQSATKKLTDARLSLNKALEIQSDYQPALDALIQLNLTENKGDEALKIAHQIQELKPKSPVGYEREADILMSQKQYALVAKAYDESLARGAGSISFIKLHRALNMAKKKSVAEQRLTSWIKQNPKDVTVRRYAADFYMKNDQVQDAITHYEELIKLTPQNVLAFNNLANLYQRTSDDRALATAELALELAPKKPSVQDTLGWILLEKGHLARSTELLREAASNAPTVGSIRYHLAVALARSGQESEAKIELEAAITIGQNFPEADDAKAMLKDL